MKPVWIVFAFVVLGCKTEIQFENQIPNASVENVRWEASDGTSFRPESDDRLEPGESSESISISEPHEGDTGRVHFELVVEGRKVALVTESVFVAHTGEATTFRLAPDTIARNPLADSPTHGEPVAAEP